MDNRDRLAVVILNWNGLEMLQRFLPSVWNYSQGAGITIYVADNASTDTSCVWLQDTFPQIALIRLDANYGFAEGYNRALKQISAEYYLLLNSDVEVTPDWLSPLLTFMDAHPKVAACQPKLLSWREKNRFEYAGACGGFLDKLGYPYCRGRIFDVLEFDDGQYDTILSVFWASGAAFLVRSVDYWACGGLDGRFFAHMEEIDLCWRLQLMGKQIYCIPTSKVYHVGGATLKKENPHKTYLNFRNNLLMLYKNLPSQQLLPVMFMRGLLDYVAAFVFLLKGNVDNAWAVLQARWSFWKMRIYRKEARTHVWKQHTTNRQLTRSEVLPILNPRSILWNYHVKRINVFSLLK